jgi:hypothetical protein
MPLPDDGRPAIATGELARPAEGDIARIGKDPRSFQQTRDLCVDLKLRTRVSV